MSGCFRFEQVQLVPKPRTEVFAFFSDAHNLERLTPGFLGFKILTPGPIEMKSGTLIDYSLRLHGIPLRWQTRIEAFEPDSRFVDTQLRGPYRRWTHIHEFEEVPGGTRMRDIVDYELPCGPLGQLANRLYVRGSVQRIFEHRRRAVAELFGEP